jgi:hypothetical protein
MIFVYDNNEMSYCDCKKVANPYKFSNDNNDMSLIVKKYVICTNFQMIRCETKKKHAILTY